MSSYFKDKVAIVTGSSSGIGEAIAISLAVKGARVSLCGRDPDRLKTVLDRAVEVSGGHKERFITVRGDLNEEDCRRDIVGKTIEAFGQLDILIANAGVSVPGSTIRDATPEIYDKTMDTNVKAVFFLIQDALPHLEKTKGNILCVSSVLNSLVLVPDIIYPVSKAAVKHMCNCLAVQLGPKGIRVNTVNPAHIPTRIGRDYEHTQAAVDWINKEKKSVALPHYEGSAEDVADAVVFLVSDNAVGITGQHLNVDGGRSFFGASNME
ncbi:unnamed protein product [Lymnaea stagnalis]|uniref:Uncharacterized protein n=1 Tax=Lymnaea stagnalis TaxID=6523 RepID=A0AAV2HFD7_LYMST